CLSHFGAGTVAGGGGGGSEESGAIGAADPADLQRDGAMDDGAAGDRSGVLGAAHVRDGAVRRRNRNDGAGRGTDPAGSRGGSGIGFVCETAPAMHTGTTCAGDADDVGDVRAAERNGDVAGNGGAAVAGGSEHRLERAARRREAAAGVAANVPV